MHLGNVIEPNKAKLVTAHVNRRERTYIYCIINHARNQRMERLLMQNVGVFGRWALPVPGVYVATAFVFLCTLSPFQGTFPRFKLVSVSDYFKSGQ